LLPQLPGAEVDDVDDVDDVEEVDEVDDVLDFENIPEPPEPPEPDDPVEPDDPLPYDVPPAEHPKILIANPRTRAPTNAQLTIVAIVTILFVFRIRASVID